ncbi:MAG TPA: class I SAM-dependent methyltransferase [Gemmatimonadaceae bacterium]
MTNRDDSDREAIAMTSPTSGPNPTSGTSQPEADKEFWATQWVSNTATGIENPNAPTWANDRDRMLLDFLRPYLPTTGTVAELGCGSARLLARIGLERPQLKLLGVDYEESALDLVKESSRAYHVPIETRLDDVNNLSFPDASFDMVLSGGLLEHFLDPTQALREMVRTLKPGGTFYASVVPRKWFSLHRPLHRWLGPQVQRTTYNAYMYANWLREAGMVDVVPLTKGVYPPLFHHLPPAPRRAIERTLRPLDGSWLADHLGYFFVLAARKPR